jgi:hypothetical protein
MTTAEQTFELSLQGVEIPLPANFEVPEQQLTAELKNGGELQPTVCLLDVSEQEADERAYRFAQELYMRFLVRFGDHIERSGSPRLIKKIFTTDGSTSTTAIVMGQALTIGHGRFSLSQRDVVDLAKDVQLRVIAPQVATSAQLYAALGMYATGLESQNKVVRFLVFYSALALAALFKWHDGRQQNVDRLILARNPQITMSASPRNKTVQETLYTKLRNDLIHAEERGCDSAAAIAAIEKHVAQFQHDVSLVFCHL